MNGTDTFLDINNAHLRVNSGNVQASAFILDQIDFIASSNASTTVGFNNATTAFLAASNIEVGTANLFVDTTTSNVGIGTNAPLDTLHVKGGTLIDGDLTVNGTISAPSTSLQGVTDTGNVTSNTVQFSNAITSLTATSNIEVAGFVGSSGTGALTVPNGTTGERPTAANGMIRYNSTTGFMEAYSGGVWAPIAQPPTVTGISPLTTLTSGGIGVGWNTGTKIVAFDKEMYDEFGYSVSMNSDGTKVIVGAHQEDPNNQTQAGSAYIYTYSGGSWDAGTKIVSPALSDGTNADDHFGVSVAMNGDGTKVIVGASYDDPDNVTTAGAAYIFTYDGSNWDTGTNIKASDKQSYDYFGHSVSMNSDGTKVIVGAYGEDGIGAQGGNDSGAVYIFTYDSSSSSWDAGERIVAYDSDAGDAFGWSVAMSGDGTKFIVGAYVDDRPSGAPTSSEAGSAYIFTYDSSSSSWDVGAKIQKTSGLTQYDQFGYSVDINSDGTKVIVGARYDNTGGAGNPNNGAAYIYTYDGSSWGTHTQIVEPNPYAAGNNFGWSVAMNPDGTKVLVGSIGENPGGAAYIYTYSDGSWDTGTKFVTTSTTGGERFGHSVSMNSDGTKVLVGAHYEYPGGTNYAGAAYIFDYRATELFDTSTQVFTATGTGIVSGSTVQLEGADGSLYSVVDATTPNAAGTQVTFKMGGLGEVTEFPPSAMTNNSSIPGYVASGSYGSNTGDAWKAFNDVVSTSSNDYWNASNGTYSTTAPYLPQPNFGVTTHDINGTLHIGHWIQLEIPNPVILTRAVIGSTSSGYQHGQFVILGHKGPLKELNHHGQGWTLLHAGSSYAASGSSLSTDVTTLSAGSTEAFSYFRVVIKSKTATTTDGHIQLNNVQFFGKSGSWDLANQPYKVRINSTSGLSGASTAVIGFPPTWTTAVGANLGFDIARSTTQTLVGTDGGGGTNRRFTIVSTIPVSSPLALPSGLTMVESGQSAGVITGQIAATGTTSVTFRLTDIGSELFTDRAINIVGEAGLYAFTSFTFTNAGATGRLGPSLATIRGHADYSAAVWRTPSGTGGVEYFKLGNDSNGTDRDGYQLWTVPVDATYKIIATGASGAAHGNVNNGYGGKIEAHFALTKGTELLLIVGQSPMAGNGTNIGGGGGGASWVLQPATGNEYSSGYSRSIYMVAGGGGGGQSQVHGAGTTRTAGVELVTSGASTGGSRGASYYGGGGAGFTSNGAGSTGGSAPSGGYSPGNGAFGGGTQTGGSYGGLPRQEGGFGGGGGANHHEGGGGGGYRGGNIPNYTTYASNGGGKSWVSAGGNGASWPAAPTYTGAHTLNAVAGSHGSIYIEKM